MADYTSIALVDDIRERASVGDKDARFSSQNIINLTNRLMKEYIVPIILSAREEYLLKSFDTTLTGTLTSVDLPEDCISMRVRDVQLWNLNNGTNPVMFAQLPRLNVSQLYAQYQGFYVQNNTLFLYPVVNNFASYTLRILYYGRPLEIVLPYQISVGVTTQNAIRITNIAGLVVSFTGTIPATFINNAIVNGISNDNPFKTILSPATISSVSSNTITLNTVSGLSVGSWVCLLGESVFPQIPVELQGFICQAVAAKILEINNMPQYAQASSKLNEIRSLALQLITDRTEAAPQKINNFNSFSSYI